MNQILMVPKTTAKPRPAPAATARHTVYQFTITLLGVHPPVWRRIQVPDCTLDELHGQIQAAMGWMNSHLHEFTIDGRAYGNPDLLHDGPDDARCLDSRRVRLSELLAAMRPPLRFRYDYDFGDNWLHQIVYERALPADPGIHCPRCVGGARACPPEDCGGPPGYADMLHALRDPTHEEHGEMLEWLGGDFDPDVFRVEDATDAMLAGPSTLRDN